LRLAECQSFGLRADIRDQHVMMTADRIERLGKCDEVTGNQPGSLMDQLIEGAGRWFRFAPVNATV
jgi:hypothetical protein